jgi:hypothetical protein
VLKPVVLCRRPLAALGALAAAFTVAGCASPQLIYAWGSYQPSLYQYLKGDGTEVTKQIGVLESELQKTRDSGKKVPPGLHGHLALLYNLAGDASSAQRHLENERRLFPESSVYIDRLLQNSARPGEKS